MVMSVVGSLTALTLAGVALAAPVVDGRGNTAAPETVDIAERSADLTPTVGSTSEGKKSGFTCGVGEVYSLRGDGHITKINYGENSNISKSNVPDLPVAKDDEANQYYNGLGISPKGDVAWAYRRVFADGNSYPYVKKNKLILYRFEGKDWAEVGQIDLSKGDYSKLELAANRFISGAVDEHGDFYFSTTVTMRGTNIKPGGKKGENSAAAVLVKASMSQGRFSDSVVAVVKDLTRFYASNGRPSNNGDIAFDSSGNMFLINAEPVSGKGGGIFELATISSDVLDEAKAKARHEISGNDYTLVKEVSVEPESTINGIAFDYDGRIFVGEAISVLKTDVSSKSEYKMRKKIEGTSKDANLLSSTDLASCGVPPTVTLKKELLGNRLDPTDQFKLSLRTGRNKAVSVDTDGSGKTVENQVGPIPFIPGEQLEISEEMAKNSVSGEDAYEAQWKCYSTVRHSDGSADGEKRLLSENKGVRGTITLDLSIEAGYSSSVECTFFNNPKPKLTLVKKVDAGQSAEMLGPEDWTLAAWQGERESRKKPVFEGKSSVKKVVNVGRYELTESPTRADDERVKRYQLESLVCHDQVANENLKIEHGESGNRNFIHLKYNQDVTCTFTNKLQEATLELKKVVQNNHGGTKKPEDFELTASKQGAEQKKYSWNADSSDKTILKVIEPGDYLLSEKNLPGYKLKNLICADESGKSLQDFNAKDKKLSVKPGDKISCTFTNQDLPGKVRWKKIDSESKEILIGSKWKLTKKDSISREPVVVEQDDNGVFSVDNLEWGTWTLTETQAPFGYLIDSNSTRTFEINPEKTDGKDVNISINDQAIVADLGNIENTRAQALKVPLTGGMSSQAFLFGGLIFFGATAFALWRSRKSHA